MKSLLVFFSCFSCLLISGSVLAAVPVDDIGSRSPVASPSVQQPSATAAGYPEVPLAPLPLNAEPVDAYTKQQMLQEEVMILRGMVEELANEVRQLKQRQMDDYMDLDRRLISGTSAPGASAAGVSAGKPSTDASGAGNSAADNKETQSYNNAYALLKGGKIDPATAAFKQHIENYPAGSYTANSYYWLGEIHLLKNQLEDARQAFTVVADNYPVHRKAGDATYKLGKVYHLLGNNKKAKTLLEQAASSAGSSGTLAKKYLSENF